jgi:lipopolysaccharide assembly outer membrane protein LptD (OstA)
MKMRFGKKPDFRGALYLLLLLVLFLSGEEVENKEYTADSLRIESGDSLGAESGAIALDSLFYSADSGAYSTKEEIISLMGNAMINYHNSSITADTITVLLKENQAFTFGESILRDSDQIALGEEIYYDLKSQWGLIFKGATKFDKGYYYGDEIRKIDKKIYDIDRGLFTTCDALHPHFFIKTDKMRMYQNDKVVGKPVLFYVNQMPVFALPYGIFSIKRGRQMGILVPYPGYNSTDGKYVRNLAFYYPYAEYADVILGGNLYEKTGWELSLNAEYIRRYLLNGSALFRFRKRQYTLYSSTYEWYLRMLHHQNIGRASSFDANITYTSSQKILENEEDENSRLAEDVTSSISYKTPLLGSTFSLSGRLVADLMEKTEVRRNVQGVIIDTLTYKLKTITLPEFSWSRPSRPVYEYFVRDGSSIDKDAWFSKFSGSYNIKGTYKSVIKDSLADFADLFWKESVDSLGAINKHDAGLRQSTSFSYSNKYKGWLNYSQSASFNLVWIDEDKLGEKDRWGNDWNLNTSMNFSMYGISNFSRGYLKAARHIISPKISYSYRPDFSRNENFGNLSGYSVASGKRQQKMSMSLGNNWQLKLRETENRKEKNINDFFKLSSSLSYDFENKITGYNLGRGFGSLTHGLDLNPESIKLAMIDLSIEPYGNITQDVYDWDFSGSEISKWDWGVSNWNLTVNSRLKISGNAGYIEYFPIEENPFTSNQFLLTDSLSLEEEDEFTTLEELEELAREENSWSINLNHSYRLTKSSYENNDYTSNLKGSFNAQLTKNWNFSYSNYYDINDKKMVSQSFTLVRELHCWRLEFRYSRQESWWNYSFKLFNIKLPDSLLFKTSDSG